MPTGTGSTRRSAASRCRGSSPPRAGRARLGAALRRLAAAAGLAALAGGAGSCVVGNPPWVAPGLRVLYRAEGAGRAGIRLLIAREGNDLAISRGAGDSGPAFDRHSGWVFFASRERGSWDLYRVRLSGEEVTALTYTPQANERWPAPSPDGRFLFFTSDEGGNDQIYRSGLDGTAAAPLTRGPALHSRAAVDSAGTALVALEGEGDAARLVSIDAQTGAATPIPGAEALPPAGRPAVRNDGAIVYPCKGSAGGSAAGPAGLDLCLVTPAGSARRLTNEAAEDRDPAWSPDGQQVAFSSNRKDGNFELYVMRADGSKVRRLTKEPGPDGEPFWVP
jgi:dipeptidyl aminopeptidase/acylaminoacyl peptidase